MNIDVVTKDRSERNTTITFTDDQKAAVDGCISFIAAPFDTAKYAIGITGSAGVGKSFITNYIIRHCKYVYSVICCTSPTHKACRVLSEAIGGLDVNTIQSVLGLRIDLRLEDFDPKHPQFNPMAKPKLENVKLLIVDEASMLPAKLVTYICNLCKKLQIKIIFIGDANQLSPVNEFKSIAFDRCFKVFKLNQIVRQAASNPIKDLLSMLRDDIDNKRYDFLNYVSNNIGAINYNDFNEGYSICNRANFKNLIDMAFRNEEYTKNIDMYRIIAYTNACVNNWNNYIRNTIIKDADKNIITKNDLIMSYETIVNEFTEVIINNSDEYIIHDIVDYVDETYGFKGFLIKFQLVHGGKITAPLFVLDHRDKYSVVRYHKVITQLIEDAEKASGGTRVSKWKEYYKFKKKYLIAINILNRNGKIAHARDIDYGFAITSHRAQGSTYNTVFVDLNDMVYSKNGTPYANQDDLLRRIYVACSRASKELILCFDNGR